MNEKEDYFRFSQSGHIHTLSDRIPLNWKQVLILPISIFILLLFITGWLVGLVIGVISGVGYLFYRFASWIYYTEIKIDTKYGRIIRLKKIFSKIVSKELITDNFDSNRFNFVELTRSGKTKFSMNYKTHKIHNLLIIRSIEGKNKIEQYIAKKIIVFESGH